MGIDRWQHYDTISVELKLIAVWKPSIQFANFSSYGKILLAAFHLKRGLEALLLRF